MSLRRSELRTYIFHIPPLQMLQFLDKAYRMESIKFPESTSQLLKEDRRVIEKNFV